MPRDLRETAQFKSDKKRVKKSGHHDWEKLRGNPGCRFSLNYGFNDIIQHVLERCLSRVAFAFEPARKAVLLVAGNKVGADQRLFYKRLI